MNQPIATFTVDVDVTNPGQFFACCGLLELAHYLWPGAEGWFDLAEGTFSVSTECMGAGLEPLLQWLCASRIIGLPAHGGQRKPERTKGEEHDDDNSGPLQIGDLPSLTLDWWVDKGNKALKTWAGRQKIRQIVRASQEAVKGVSDVSTIFSLRCVLDTPEEDRKGKRVVEKIDATCFYARRSASALDTGWSPNDQGFKTYAYPAIELLCLIGLQRFRPQRGDGRLSYWAWSAPLSAPVGAAVASGSVLALSCQGYSFRILNRDAPGRYKAFGFATQIGDHE